MTVRSARRNGLMDRIWRTDPAPPSSALPSTRLRHPAAATTSLPLLKCFNVSKRGSHNQGGGSVDCPKQRLYVRARHERSRHPAQGAKRKPDCAQRVDRVLEREHRRPLRPHSITSSARARKGMGTVRPRLLAVFRLMKNSTLVTSWIGKSDGFSPFRTRPA